VLRTRAPAVPLGARAERVHPRLTLARLPAIGSGVYLLGFLVAGVFRLVYPYPLEIMEGVSLSAVRRILAGQPLYGPPSLEFVPLVYSPLYFWLAALVARLTGPDFLALRLVSLLATIGSAGLIYDLVRRETGLRALGLLSAGVFVGSTPLAITTLDLGRVDALGLLFVLGAVYFMRLADLEPGRMRLATAASGLLAGLAILTKQTEGLLAVALLVYAARWPRTRLLPYVATLVLTVGSVLLVLYGQAGDWVKLYLFDLPRMHHLQEQYLWNFWSADILPRFTLPLAIGPLFLVARRRDGRAVTLYALTVASLLVTAWIARLNLLASVNVLAPAFAGLAILFGLALGEALRLAETGVLRGYVFGLALAQLVLLGYNPRLTVPLRSDGWAGDRLVATIGGLKGNVFAPDFGEFARRAGKGDQPYTAGPMELVGGFGGGMSLVGQQYVEQLDQALAQRRYDYVLLEPQSNAFYLKAAVEGSGYVDTGPLFPPGDEFYLWKTSLTPDAHLYVPRERGSR
jgi:4-amino-4-deoxy-L-arabinose transferase-like glycosyltransferase